MPQERPIDAVAAGHICLDIIPRFPGNTPATVGEIFQPGKLVFIEEATVSTGGSVSNTGIALVILGLRVGFCTKVGDDLFGRETLARLEARGTADGVKVTQGEASSYTLALAPPAIDRIFLHNPGTNNTFTSDDINWDLVAKARLFHLGYPPLMRSLYEDGGRELARIFQRAKEHGATTSLDTAMPDPSARAGQVNWTEIFDRTLPHVDIFLPSVEELFLMLDRAAYLKRREAAAGRELLEEITPDEIAQWGIACLARGCAIAGMKCGYLGLYCHAGSAERIAAMGPAAPAAPDTWAGKELWCPGFVVDRIASATGAGDSAYAGFLAALLRGMSLEQCLRFANIVGAENLSALDALSGVRSWQETVTLEAAPPWRTRPLALGPRWHWDETAGVWRAA